MNILLIDNFFYYRGGAESVFFNTGKLLEKYGHHVHYFSQNRPENLFCKDSSYFSDATENMGTTRKVISYFYNKAAANMLEYFLKNHKIDLAHVHLFWGGLSPSIFHVLKKYQIPLIHTVHDFRMVCPASTFKDRAGKICERCCKRFFPCIIQKCAKGHFFESIIMAMEVEFRNLFFPPEKNLNGLIFVSRFSADKHFEHRPALQKIPHILLHNFTETCMYNTRPKKYFLYIGRLSTEKGILTLLKTFLFISNEQLLIVGDGPQKKEIEAFIASHECRNIILAGFKGKSEIRQLLEEAKALILPSEWYENNPMTILEAYSSGIPVVASAIGGIPEIVRNGDTGFLFESGNMEHLRETLQHIIDMPFYEYSMMCHNAYHYCKQNFSSEGYYQNLISFYKKIKENYD